MAAGMTTFDLDKSYNVTLDGSGNGTITFGPDVEDMWIINTFSITVDPVSPATLVDNEPTFSLYTGYSTDTRSRIDGTYSGSQNVRTLETRLRKGQRLTAKWTGGDVGARATLRISGTFEQKGIRGYV